jgi:2-C-methyl-D-erythritol 4-phosphate cytidylyltransferase
LKKFAIVVAGGSGSRMNNSVPKQFLHVHNKPIIAYTIENFINAIPDINLIIVLPKVHFDLFDTIKNEFLGTNSLIIAEGGETRFHSVQNGLNAIGDTSGKVLVHDAVRPMASSKLIINLFDELDRHNAVIPVIKMKNSLRKLNADGSSNSVDRNQFIQVQTPQAFDLELIKKAYHQDYRESFTDDASIAESAGNPVYLIQGEENNIKITDPGDLKLAICLLQGRNKSEK